MSEDIKAKSLNIENLVDYQKDTVVSREVIKKELGTVTFFAFDKGPVVLGRVAHPHQATCPLS